MGFQDCDDAMGPGLFFGLEDDNDMGTVKLMGEPMPRHGTYRNKPRTQYVFPVVSEDGLQLWTVGAKLYRRLRDDWKKYSAGALKVTRHGEKNDQQTTYGLQPVTVLKSLAKLAKAVSKKDVADIMEPPSQTGGKKGGDDIPF